MKTWAVLVQLLARDRGQRANTWMVLRSVMWLMAAIGLFTALFHLISVYEGQTHSWLSGLYWTITTMSTLGYGDITFKSDLGRLFSVVVMLSGLFMLLVMMPFTFVEFFYAPWMRAQSTARAPRQLPADIQGHVLFTALDPITEALIAKLTQHGVPYAILVEDLTRALALHDRGLSVMVGAADDPAAWTSAQVGSAGLIVATADELANTNVTFTVRELNPTAPIIATARTDNGEEILKLAGASEVLRLGRLLGSAMARRTHGGDALAHVIGRFDDLVVAEALVRGTPLVGRTLRDSNIKQTLGLTVACVWERGHVALARADTVIGPNTALVMVGSQDQVDAYDAAFCIYQAEEKPVLILGGGRVGRAVAADLKARRVPYRIIERNPDRVAREHRAETLVGDATDPELLAQAGLSETSTVLVTTHDDDANIFLTICCRRLRPDVEIIARATLPRNIGTLHRAGADLVLSYAAMGANLLFNRLNRQSIMHVAEGLDLVAVPITNRLSGKSLRELDLPGTTGCLAVALRRDGRTQTIVDASTPLPAGSDLIVVGDAAAEKRLIARVHR